MPLRQTDRKDSFTALQPNPTSGAEGPAERTEAEGRQWHAKGLAFYRNGEIAEAAQAFGRACECGGPAVVWNDYGTSLFALKRIAEAEQAYKKALQLEPGHKGATANLAALYVVMLGGLAAGRPEASRAPGHQEAQRSAPAQPAGAARAPILDAFDRLPMAARGHAAGVFPTRILRRVEEILPPRLENSAETGCGKSTVLFSNLAGHHTVFALDDTGSAGSSVKFFRECPLTRNERIEAVFGPTQQTLPAYQNHREYDAVLLDGPHAYPFPEMEYLAFYPHIRRGGYLILDDVNIPTIGRLADFIAEDEMFELIDTIESTAIFRRTSARVFDPTADGWWTQRYNRRRVSPKRDIFLNDGEVIDVITSQRIDRKVHGG